MKKKEIDLLLKDIESSNVHPSDIANLLTKEKLHDEDKFYLYLNKLPDDMLGSVLVELPEAERNDAVEKLNPDKLKVAIEELETDDATDLYQEIEEVDEDKAKEVFESLDSEDKAEINLLRKYSEEQAGAFMQIELFDAKLDETIKDAVRRLRRKKNSGELENIHQVFITDEFDKLIGAISLEELITFKFSKTFREVLNEHMEFIAPMVIHANMDIREAVKIFEKYNFSVLPVVNYEGKLLGRITSDDVYDIIEESATEQIYNLAGVDDEAEENEDIKEIFKKRSFWLLINLFTAIIASVVIGLFDETISSYVALAVLMPIVASMGGNAGTQTLTVVVRQLALGEIDFENAKVAIKKEVIVAVFNGFLFALVMGLIAMLWFSNYMLGVVIGLSMIINLFAAGFFGAMIPLMLKKFKIDPAVGSTVLLTTVTDVVGFFSFLALAKAILL